MGTPYASYTYEAKHPLRRMAHRRRLSLSLALIPREAEMERPVRLLDFGCGDGHFLELLHRREPTADACGYEPFWEERTALSPIYETWEQILRCVGEGGAFDVVTAFEVFEHLPESVLQQAIAQIHTVLAPSGRLILSVPIEYGCVGFVKGMIRRREPRFRAIYTPRVLCRTLCGLPLDELRTGSEYLDHVGFHPRSLLPHLEPHFTLEQQHYSPFRYGGTLCNSQLFCFLRKR